MNINSWIIYRRHPTSWPPPDTIKFTNSYQEIFYICSPNHISGTYKCITGLCVKHFTLQILYLKLQAKYTQQGVLVAVSREQHTIR